MSDQQPPAAPGEPEYLDSRGGVPGVPGAAARPSSSRGALWAVVGVLGLVVVGGGAWAAWSFFSTGEQPAEALPDSTLAYMSIDLDPSGGQKIEALRTLNKFPAFEDEVGLDTDDDIREWIFDRAQESGDCQDLDYADDVEPWLGDRFAGAVVDTGADEPSPVFVLQVKDEDAADEGLAKIRDCAGGDDSGEEGAWTIRDGWLLLGESQDLVDQIADDAADAPLSSDDDFRHWTDEAGGTGIANLYAAPAAGKFLADNLDDLGSFGSTYTESASDDGRSGYGVTADAAPEELKDALEDFPGAAAAVRFDDGGLEVEVAGGGLDSGSLAEASGAGDALADLPESTVAAVGVGLYDGWGDDLLDAIAAQDDSGSIDDALDQLEQETGITLPDDAEALLGDSVAVAVDERLDPDALGYSPEAGGSTPTGVGVRIQGDPDEIDSALDKLRSTAGDDEGVLDSDSDGDAVVLGADEDYRSVLLDDRGLGGTDGFRDAVEHADDAAFAMYVDVDRAADWLADADADAELRDNVEPLSALGLSMWFDDDDTSHAVLKITTD